MYYTVKIATQTKMCPQSMANGGSQKYLADGCMAWQWEPLYQVKQHPPSYKFEGYSQDSGCCGLVK